MKFGGKGKCQPCGHALVLSKALGGKKIRFGGGQGKSQAGGSEVPRAKGRGSPPCGKKGGYFEDMGYANIILRKTPFETMTQLVQAFMESGATFYDGNIVLKDTWTTIFDSLSRAKREKPITQGEGSHTETTVRTRGGMVDKATFKNATAMSLSRTIELLKVMSTYPMLLDPSADLKAKERLFFSQLLSDGKIPTTRSSRIASNVAMKIMRPCKLVLNCLIRVSIGEVAIRSCQYDGSNISCLGR